jgi:hypothetical protein
MIHVSNCVTDGQYWSSAFKSPPDLLVVHRFGPSIQGKKVLTDRAVKNWFRQKEAGTGSKFPYHFLVWVTPHDPLSIVVQKMLPLNVRGVAQRKWNARSLCLAVIGDWRREQLPEKALYLLGDFCSGLREQHDLKYLAGHSELPDGSKWTDHICPGLGIDLLRLRDLSGLKDIFGTLPENV